MLKRLLLTAFLFVGLQILECQQSPVYSQYILNEFLINPAVAGRDGMTSINLSGRKQWVGFQHTPETYSVCISTRLLKSPLSVFNGKRKKGSTGRIGLGASLISDQNGAIHRTTFQITYAYHVFIGNSQLSFGLSGISTQFKIDENLATLKNPDAMEGVIGKSTYIPDAAAGVNLSTIKYNIGFSVSQLLQSPVKFGDVNLNAKDLQQIRQYSLYGYYRSEFKNNSDWEVEPSALIRTSEDLQFSIDLSSRFIYKKEYWTGLSFRTSGECVLLMGVKVNRFYFGYSFDYGFNQISQMTYGSHEVSIAIKLGDSSRRYRWIERY
jgi:type IX secretion system PorP/SprF family membrane protein